MTILLLLILALWVVLQLPPVQTFLINRLTVPIEIETGYDLGIGHVDLRFPLEIVLEEVYAIEPEGDTLLTTREIAVSGIGQSWLEGNIRGRKLLLREPDFRLRIADGDSITNMDRLLQHFAADTSSGDSTQVEVFFYRTEIRNGAFSFHNENKTPIEDLIDFNHLDLDSIGLSVTDASFSGMTIAAQIGKLHFKESKGFDLKELSGAFLMRNDSLTLEEMTLRTPGSELNGMYGLRSSGWSDYSQFTSKVYMDADLDSSVVDFRDIAFFSRELQGLNRKVAVDGSVRGTVNNLKGRRLYIGLDERTWFRGRIDMAGLPNIEQTFIDLSVNELHGVKRELDNIPIPPFDQGKTLKTPQNFYQLGEMEFSGKFTGFLNDFVAFGTLETAIGDVRSDIQLSEGQNFYEYRGSLETIDFDLGAFYLTTSLGKVSSSVTIDGRGLTRDELNASVNGKVSSLEVQDYIYTDITANGAFRENYFSGELNVSDENVQLFFDGLIDFRRELPELDFFASITHLNPVALNLAPLDDYTAVSGDFNMKATGIELNTINGSIVANDLLFCTSRAEYPVDTLSLELDQADGRKLFVLESDVASGRLEGKFNFKGVESGVKEIVADIIPQYEAPEGGRNLREDFSLELKVHSFELVSQVFLPEMELSQGSRFELTMDDETEQFELLFTTDHVAWGDVVLDTVLLDISHPDESLYLTLLADQIAVGAQESQSAFRSVSLDARNESDTVYTNLAWGRPEDLIRGDLAAETIVKGNTTFDNTLSSATLWFDDRPWSLQDTAFVAVDGRNFSVDSFYLGYKNAYLKINGEVNDRPRSALNVDAEGFNLSFLNTLLASSGLRQEGLLTGRMTLQNAYNEPLISSDITILEYGINDYDIGDICVESIWLDDERRLRLGGEIEREKEKNAIFSGYYYPDRKRSPLDMECTLNELSLAFVNAFIQEGISDINGLMSGKISITGSINEPQLEGVTRFTEASLLVEYLNTRYYFEEEAEIFPDAFWLDFPVRDEDGNEAFAAGTIVHNNFSDWNFDVYLDMEQQPFLCLNTSEEDNSLYYGKAYARGYVSVFGTEENLEIDVNAATGPNTQLVLPLGGTEEVTFEDFITFVDYSNPEPEEEKVDLSGISLNFELDITTDARFRIVFDELVGDEINGRGKGHITMGINNLSSFNMYGDVELTEGRYLFTLKNLINKAFEVVPGGRISWYGDPLAADVDLKALYRVNTSVNELMPGESEQYTQRIPVNLIMNLDGNLMSPGIRFDIELPTADELTRGRVQSVISNEQEMNRQAFALLVLRRFISPPDISKTNTSIGLAENSTEVLSSQLSNWLSQISDDFDIGVNYSPGDELTNEELAVALSTQLFNDRLRVSGNFGVSQAQNPNSGENPNSLIGDLRVEYMVTPEGKIRLIVYNESNQFDLANTQQSNYTQGIGVVYEEEFDSISELFKLKP